VRLRSAIRDADRYFNGKVSKEIERFVSGLPNAPQGVTDGQFVFGYETEEGDHILGLIETNEDLQKYTREHPKSWAVVEKAMGLTRAFSKHACAYVLSDIPISEVVPVKEGFITHYEHKDVEKAGLVKMDFLTISQLLDIQICLELINKKNGDTFEPGYFTHNGIKTYIWDLPDEADVYKSVWNGSTETLFQINSTGQSELAQEMLPSTLEDIAAALALERPGPKDYKDPETGHNMVKEYLLRRRGEKEPDIKELAEILPEAHGVMYFQEHLGKIAKQLAGFTDEEAEILRENMAKKYMVELTKIKPSFIAGASKKVPLEVAEKIWDQMVTFGRYGFSIIHSYEYAKITYACMFLRHNYRLDWWAAVLSNADEKEITGKFWKHAKELIAPPDINLSSDVFVPDYRTGKIRAKLGIIRGMGEKTADPIVANRPYKDIQDFVNKDVTGPSLAHKLIHVGVLDSLFKESMSLEEKLKAYEDAVEIKKYQDKKAKAEAEGKKFRLTQPKSGSVPPAYVNLHPMKDVAMKKAVLPTMYADLYGLGAKYSKVIDKWSSKPKVIDPKFNKSVFLVDGNTVERLDKLDSMQIENDIYVAATGYVVDIAEKDYHKGTKRMLKMVVACDNYISEKILWPDYETQELVYDRSVKKGSIITLFLRKRAQKGGELNVTKFVLET
jgi:DNA polymerase III alpha subunit